MFVKNKIDKLEKNTPEVLQDGVDKYLMNIDRYDDEPIPYLFAG